MFRRLAILSSPPVKFPPSCLVDLIKHVRDAEDTDDEEIGFSDILFYGYSFRNVFTEAADEVLQMQMQSPQIPAGSQADFLPSKAVPSLSATGKISITADCSMDALNSPTNSSEGLSEASFCSASSCTEDAKVNDSSGVAAAVLLRTSALVKHDGLRDLVYPMFPESMRNPESCKWLVDDPKGREHLVNCLKQHFDDNTSPFTAMVANSLTWAKDYLAKESISLDRLVTHLLYPSTCQYLKSPSEVHWVNVDPDLKAAVDKIGALLLSSMDPIKVGDMRPYFSGVDSMHWLSKLIGLSFLSYLTSPTEDGWKALDPDIKAMIQGMDAVFEEFNLSPPSIDMRSLMSKLVGPTFLQYLKHPTDERWLSLDPELKALIQKYGDDLAVMIDEGLPGDLKPYLAGINFCGLLTMLTSPSVLQFMYSLAKEEWMCLNPDLKTLIWKTANGLFKWKAQGCPFDFIADFDGLWEAVKIVVLDPIRLFLEDSAVRSFFESEAESDWADRWLAIHEEGRMVLARMAAFIDVVGMMLAEGDSGLHYARNETAQASPDDK